MFVDIMKEEHRLTHKEICKTTKAEAKLVIKTTKKATLKLLYVELVYKARYKKL